MTHDNNGLSFQQPTPRSDVMMTANENRPPLKWDWTIEHKDQRREARADSAAQHLQHPFQVDRKVLKDVVREKMRADVGRIKFLNSGTFHKAYLVTLVNHFELIARVARRLMPRLKTESEVATMRYLRENTSIPVPMIYHYDSNPYNRLGGEYILMSKAEGVPLSQIFHSMAHAELVKLLDNLAALIIPLFSHRFTHIGSLYCGPEPSSIATPKPRFGQEESGYPFNDPTSINATTPRASQQILPSHLPEFHIGPIISWAFFGSNRGELSHPDEIDRGPWETTEAYLSSCEKREIDGVERENAGSAAPHRLHLDPDEIQSSRYHHLKAVPGDESDESDEWDMEESEEEEEGPGDAMYRDYRRMQRSTFLFAHLAARLEAVKQEMERWKRLTTKLVEKMEGEEEFGMDCHDLSLENVFVQEGDHSKITCVIDWESTTIRPLWACAHVPSFLQSSPFVAELFRNAVRKLVDDKTKLSKSPLFLAYSKTDRDVGAVTREWLYYEAEGIRLRFAHRCVEWDGWEEGLVESILGPVDQEEDWYQDYTDDDKKNGVVDGLDCGGGESAVVQTESGDFPLREIEVRPPSPRNLRPRLPFAVAKEMTKTLDTTGDICGGRGGELGRRLEAWLSNTDGERVSRDIDVDEIEQAGYTVSA